MIQDLTENDLNLKDDITKLSYKKFNLEGHLIVISGIPRNIELPSTVSGKGHLDPHSSLPIACGIIKKVTNIPGKIDHDYTGIFSSEMDKVIDREDDGAFFENPPIDNYGND